MVNIKKTLLLIPVVIHVFYLFLHVAVNAFAVCAVGQSAHHAKPIRTLLSGKEFLNRYSNALSTPLTTHTHHFLP